MAVKFYNIRTGETRTAENEPQIAALWSSSDHSPNITQGQDFGWRLAPEINIELKTIKQDYNRLQEVARAINKNIDEVNESDILMYISSRTAADYAPVATAEDYQDEYDQEVRRRGEAIEAARQAAEARAAGELPTAAPSSTTTTTTESLADLKERVELAERLAAATAAAAAPTTTTTTTGKPETTTTTTTKK